MRSRFAEFNNGLLNFWAKDTKILPQQRSFRNAKGIWFKLHCKPDGFFYRSILNIGHITKISAFCWVVDSNLLKWPAYCYHKKALLRKLWFERATPYLGRASPARWVSGTPRAVKRLRMVSSAVALPMDWVAGA